MSEPPRTCGRSSGASRSSAQSDAAGEIGCGRKTSQLDDCASADPDCSLQRQHTDIISSFSCFQMLTTPTKLDTEVLEAASKLLQVRFSFSVDRHSMDLHRLGVPPVAQSHLPGCASFRSAHRRLTSLRSRQLVTGLAPSPRNHLPTGSSSHAPCSRSCSRRQHLTLPRMSRSRMKPTLSSS